MNVPTGERAVSEILRRVAGASAINLLLQGLSTGLGLLTGLLLSRLLGAAGLGVYAFGFALASVLSILARLGLESLLVREVAVAVEGERWSVIKGLVRFSEGASLTVGAALGAVAVAWSMWASEPQTTATVVWAMVLLLGMSANQLRSGALRGLDAVTAAQIPGLGVRPVLFLVGLLALVATQGTVQPSQAMMVHALAYGAAWLLSVGLWRRYRPAPVRVTRATYTARRWMRSALPLLVVGGFAVVNLQADLMMLKWMASDSSTGIYAVCAQLARFVGLFIAVVNAVISARLAALYHAERFEELQRVVTATAAGITMVTVPAGLLLVAGAPWILALYGEAFVEGRAALTVLVGAQMIAALSGSVGALLLMSGQERAVGWASSGTALLNVALNLALIPRLDLLGAAIASATSLVAWHLILVYQARAVLRMRSTAVGWLAR